MGCLCLAFVFIWMVLLNITHHSDIAKYLLLSTSKVATRIEVEMETNMRKGIEITHDGNIWFVGDGE